MMSNRPVTRTEFAKGAKQRIILFGIIIAFILFIGWYGEYGSCIRARDAATIQAFNAKRIDEALHIHIVTFPRLECEKLLPDR